MAATRVARLLEHFPRVQEIIMVGIAGGVPYPEKPDEHVRPGDIMFLINMVSFTMALSRKPCLDLSTVLYLDHRVLAYYWRYACLRLLN